MTIDRVLEASLLFQEGWTWEDREELIEEYDLTEGEADELCKALEYVEDHAVYGI